MAPKIDKYGFTKYEDVLGFTDEVFEPINRCILNNLYQDCVLQINPKTYEYSVCKANEAIPGNDVYPLSQFAKLYNVTGKMITDHNKVYEVVASYFYIG
jgi:hypothetical protein